MMDRILNVIKYSIEWHVAYFFAFKISIRKSKKGNIGLIQGGHSLLIEVASECRLQILCLYSEKSGPINREWTLKTAPLFTGSTVSSIQRKNQALEWVQANVTSEILSGVLTTVRRITPHGKQGYLATCLNL